MARNEGFRRYFEAAAVLGEITRARAEDLVREMKGTGDSQRAQAQQWVDELVERSRKAAEDMLDLVRTEVSNQLHALGLDPDELARQAADIMRRSAAAGKRAMKDAAAGAGKGARSKGPAGADKAPGAKKAPAPEKPPGGTKKSAAKKSAAKKAAGTKKAAAKKASKRPGAS